MTPEEERILFHLELGHAITQWADVEGSLFEVIAYGCKKHERPDLAQEFFQDTNFRFKIELVTGAILDQAEDRGMGEQWWTLVHRLEGGARTRNKMAHWLADFDEEARIGRRWGLVPRFRELPSIMIDMGFAEPGEMPLPNATLYVYEIIKTRYRYAALCFALENFAARVRGKKEPYPKASETVEEPPKLAEIIEHFRTLVQHPKSKPAKSA